MNQNWIVENLNNAFSTWNGKLTELWGLVTTSPQTFKGGAVWGVMQSLHNAMIGIGYALIVLFFAISLFKNTANFHELKRPEAAVHYLIRFVAAKTLVGYGMDIMLNIFSICNGVVSDTEMIIRAQNHRALSSSWLIKGNKKKGKAQSRRYQRQATRINCDYTRLVL